MEIEVGNTVFVIDEDLSGKVTRVEGNRIAFECEDGFEYVYFRDQLIITNEEGKVSHEVKAYKEKSEISYTKATKEESDSRLFEEKIKFKGSKPEFDLHIEEIAPHAKFNTKHDALLFQMDFVRHV
ncbi:MAG: hypothetical protein HUJ25_00175, partial [Crocinitomicaceae bacterium]|nr:hypothetical protein [Crocinitomicaceae bacterium]